MIRRSREYLILAAAIGAIVAFSRFREFPSLSGLAQVFADEKPTELVVWHGENPVGKTWANLGQGGAMHWDADAGYQGKGKPLTIKLGGEGHRACGLNWKGWYPADAMDDVSRFRSLSFRIRQTGDVAGLDLQVALVDNSNQASGESTSNWLSVINDGGLKRIDQQWQRVTLPLEKFARNKPLRLDRLWGIDFLNSGKAQATIQIDRLTFGMEQPPAPKFAPKPAFHATGGVDLAKPGHSINDGIYGVCGLPDQALRDYRLPMTRWGGNSSTRYNWKINADNGASDWYFKNRGAPISDLSQSGYLRAAQDAAKRSAALYLTLPMIGWVAKDHHSYGFSVKKYGEQKLTEPGHPDIGDGVLAKGGFVRNNDPRDTSIAVGPEFIAEAVEFLAKRSPATAPRYYALDNEPMIWHQTHRDVRPEPLGYDELWDRTVRYAEAIKKADPSAKVAGFCSWGWTDLFYSARDEGGDRYATRPDSRAHGNMPLGEWFIKKCGEYKKRTGKTLIDVFDLHWYPQAEIGGKTPYLGQGMDPGLNDLRLRVTRDLWDPAYQQESWIRGASDGQPTRVLRRVKEWVDRHNPGMEICLGEYNFGGGDTITGGLAQADVFGILAQEKIDRAFLWHTPEGTQNLAWKLFRDYDGAGGRFGDLSLPATSSHPDIALHAARRADGATTIAAINKNLGGACELRLNLPNAKGKLRVWRFEQGSDHVEEVRADAKDVNGVIQLTLPPGSASMLVVR
jgi:hypothetical protein